MCFAGLSGDKFRFDSNGDGPARYNIIHFKRTDEDSFRWFKVGEYIEGELTLNMSGECNTASFQSERSFFNLNNSLM